MVIRKRNKLVHGFGINDAEYNVYQYDENHKVIWRCPFYVRWYSILERCYSKAYQDKHPTYIGCSIFESWLSFSNFKAWMETQDWENKDIDKDLLVEGNKIYSPDTCVFVSQRTNKFILERKSLRGDFPIGVSFHSLTGKFQASCKSVVTGKKQHLKLFNTAEEAFEAWLSFKLKQAYIIASEQTDKRIAQAIISRYENYKMERS